MENSTLTASAIMSFAEKLEDDSAVFYSMLAARFDEGKEVFLGFAKESKKNKTHLIRTYQETISDALEASFSFEGLELTEFDFEVGLAKDTGFKDALKVALEIEEEAAELYVHIAEQAQSLLATIPRAFSRVAKKRRARRQVLQTMLDGA
jgi:rubrerythrin